MFKNNVKRGAAALLALSLIAMSGCSGKPDAPQSTDGTGSTAMGRYVERPYETPEGTALISGVKENADGSAIEMIVYAEGAKNWQHYSRADGGEWLPDEQSFMEVSGLTDFDAGAIMPNGSILLAGRFFSDEFNAKMMELSDGTGYFDNDELVWPKMQFMVIGADGTKREIPITLPDKAANSTSQILAADNGDVLACGYSEVYQFDGVTGELKNTFAISAKSDSIAVSGNRLAVMDGGVAQIFDMDSGEKLETVEELGMSVPKGETDVTTTADRYVGGVAAAGSDGAFYFCNSTGIYRKTADGGVVERLLDGSLVSLGTPSVTPAGMTVLKDSILVTLRGKSGNEMTVKEYVFDPSVPTLPDKELRVYALKDNKTVRQAMSSYQLAHPDTHVVMELPAEGVTQSDALRTLSTQLLAGKGPDVLLLDGMPIESYREKKVLLPLDEALADGLFPNIAAASRAQDGKLYTLPARFSLPLMAGDSAGIGTVKDINSFADLITKLSAANPKCKSPLQNCGSGVLLNTVYPVFESNLYTDGKLDEARLTEFLTACKQIIDLQNPEDAFVTDAAPDAILDITWNSVDLRWGRDLMGIGHIKSVMSFASAADVMEDVANSGMLPLSPSGSNLFIPLVQLGINSGSGNREAALELVKLALSGEIQEFTFDDGLPVSSSAFDTMFAPRPEGSANMMTFGGSGDDGKTLIATVKFPKPEQVAQLRGWIDELDTASAVDTVLLELLRSETTGYFSGTTGLEETITSLMQKLTLRQAE